jgi:hypothetical protein
MPLVSRPCNSVNYRAGTGARCKQQERNRLPVKGEIYRRTFVIFLNELTKSESRRSPNRHITGATTGVFSASTKRKRSGRQGAPCLDAGLSARVPRVRAMKNPARFSRPGSYTRISAYTFLHESCYMSRQFFPTDNFPDSVFFPTEFFSGELFFAAAFDGKTISQAPVPEEINSEWRCTKRASSKMPGQNLIFATCDAWTLKQK